MRYPADKIYQICQELFVKHKYEYKSVDVVYISQIYISEYLLGLYDEKVLTKQLKKYSLDDVAKYIYYKKSNLFNRKKNTSSNDDEIIFFFEIKNNSMIENLMSLYNYMERSHKNVSLAGNNQRLVTEEIRNVFTYSKFFTSIFNSYRIRKDLQQLAELISNDLKVKLPMLDKNNFRKYLYHHFMNNIFTIDTMDSYVKSQNSHKFVLVTDVHKWSRILAILVKKYSKETYVLQHGATVLEYGYLPVTTDNFISWGKLSKKWLVQRGAKEHKIKVLGSPKFDELFQGKESSTYIDEHILIIINPVGIKNIKSFFSIILPVLKKLQIKTVIKLHPSSDDYKELVEKIFTEPFFTIIKYADTNKLIQKSKTVISTTSSVGIETILLNKPLLQVKIKDLPKMDYEDYHCQHDVINSDNVLTLLSDDILLKSKLVNYDNFIKDYSYSFDGESKKYISEFITND